MAIVAKWRADRYRRKSLFSNSLPRNKAIGARFAFLFVGSGKRRR
jgi:hypothetical protein